MLLRIVLPLSILLSGCYIVSSANMTSLLQRLNAQQRTIHFLEGENRCLRESSSPRTWIFDIPSPRDGGVLHPDAVVLP